MSETLVLDPTEECPGRVEIDITRFVGGTGPDFGQAAVDPYRAQAQIGEDVVAFRIPNRTVTIPLVVGAGAGWTFDTLRSALQAKVGLWQREGGVLKRETAIGPVYADIQTAALTLGGSTAQAVQGIDADAVLTLEVTPDWYGDEIDLGTESGDGTVIRILSPERGDHPGRLRIIVTDTEGAAQLGCLWGIRSRNYDDAPSAALAFEAEGLTPVDAATVTTQSGASGGGSNNVVEHDSIGSGWTPVLLTDVDGVGPMTHRGSYRVFARCLTASGGVRIRLAWDVGDLTNPLTNSAVTPPSTNAFYLLDLGEVHIDPAPVGAHRWRGQVQAIGQSGGEQVMIDRLLLQPLDEYAGTLRAPTNTDAGLQPYIARDEFNQAAGNLNGKTAAVGGAWATSLAGDDFTVDANHYLVSDDNDGTSLAIIGSPSLTTCTVSVDVRLAAGGALITADLGVLARYVDGNNYIRVRISPNAIGGFGAGSVLRVSVVVAGDIDSYSADLPFTFALGAWYTVRAYVDASGRLVAWAFPQGSLPGSPVLILSHVALATGGALEAGKIGIYDQGDDTSILDPSTRQYDNFAAWVPDLDAVIHPSQALELRTDGVYRANPGGGSYGPVSWITGDLPRLPAPGLESRAVELLVKPTRGDLDQMPDTAPGDGLTVDASYRPSYLYVPDGGPGS